ncbi:hypothetical protein [Paraburkholderia phosphatilytica]|uniref:hypothetical protein n=1 Tax=Paraburkholderia phosphatilytica TaxID=2282883 RepID=UPI000E5301E3|nr:hypothetical protein [Paraburkholderia phosphatilytica]
MVRRSAQSRRASVLTPRCRRANDLLVEARSAALHRYERLTRAFEAIYLCCIDIATAQQQELAPTGHPQRKLVDGALLVIDLPDDEAVAIARLLRWCRFEVAVDDEPGTPEAACELALKVLQLTMAWHEAQTAQTRKPKAAKSASGTGETEPDRRRTRAPRRRAGQGDS